MNIIQYLENKISIKEYYFRLKQYTPTIHHLKNNINSESGTYIWSINHAKAKTLEEACIIQVLNDEMKYGHYYWDSEETEKAILELNIKHLRLHYKTNFKEMDNSILLSDFTKHLKNTTSIVHKNYDWKIKYTFNDLLSELWIKEKTIKAYILQSLWNEEDYLFQTENHFIRLSWSTSG